MRELLVTVASASFGHIHNNRFLTFEDVNRIVNFRTINTLLRNEIISLATVQNSYRRVR